MIIIFVVVSAWLVIPFNEGKAQNETSTEVSSMALLSVVVIVPIAARETSQLNFGRFFPGRNGGTITISPRGDVRVTSEVVVATTGTSAGSFAVSGQGDATYAISLPGGGATLMHEGDSKTMEVNDWVTIPENGDAHVRLVGGTQTVLLGATLKVGSLDQNPKGMYTGSYEITFGYN